MRESRSSASNRTAQHITAAFASLEQQRAADVAACARLLDGVRALDRSASLSEILDALVDAASHEVARAGLLLVRHGEMRGWRFSGFGPIVDPAHSLVVRIDESGIVGEAVRTGVAVTSESPGACAAPAFARLPADRVCLAVPVIVSGDVAAVLYADQGLDEEENRRASTFIWTSALELLVRHAARCLEAATAIKAVRVLTDPPEISESARSTASVADQATSLSADLVMARSDTREHELNTSS